MIYTPMTNKAMRLAYQAHHGQVDGSGLPYIFHSYHIAEQMPDEVTVCVALLHDVAEDTSITLEELEAEFPAEVTDALRLLTHEQGEDYFDYVRTIKKNPVAMTVKVADLVHNSDETRLTGCRNVSADQMAHWRAKYKKAREILGIQLNNVDNIKPA